VNDRPNGSTFYQGCSDTKTLPIVRGQSQPRSPAPAPAQTLKAQRETFGETDGRKVGGVSCLVTFTYLSLSLERECYSKVALGRAKVFDPVAAISFGDDCFLNLIQLTIDQSSLPNRPPSKYRNTMSQVRVLDFLNFRLL
jgi:hypothetical protein